MILYFTGAREDLIDWHRPYHQFEDAQDFALARPGISVYSVLTRVFPETAEVAYDGEGATDEH